MRCFATLPIVSVMLTNRGFNFRLGRYQVSGCYLINYYLMVDDYEQVNHLGI